MLTHAAPLPRCFDATVYLRALALWRRLEAWTAAHCGGIRASLAPGAGRNSAARAQLDAVLASADVRGGRGALMLRALLIGESVELLRVIEPLLELFREAQLSLDVSRTTFTFDRPPDRHRTTTPRNNEAPST